MPKTPNIGPGMPATGAGKNIIGQKVRPGAFDDDDFWQLLLVQNKNQVMFSVSVRAETSDSTEKKRQIRGGFKLKMRPTGLIFWKSLQKKAALKAPGILNYHIM